MSNSVLRTIKNRRSSLRFTSTPVDAEKLNAVLEAGRWAPSWTNMQPWRFIVVKDEELKERMSGAVSTFFSLSIKDAPLCIAVCVNPEEDSFHFVEDGATATQNMALAAQSLGLGSSWIGVFSLSNEKNSTENRLKAILKVPMEWRLIAVLPLGIPRFKEKRTRKELSELVDWNFFATREKREPLARAEKEVPSDVRNIPEPVSARELERALM